MVLSGGLRSQDAFVLQRCQILLSNSQDKRASQIASELGCDTDPATYAFNRNGLAALSAGSSVPHRIEVGVDTGAAEPLRALLHQSPLL